MREDLFEWLMKQPDLPMGLLIHSAREGLGPCECLECQHARQHPVYATTTTSYPMYRSLGA